MTAAELISKLQEMDPSHRVAVYLEGEPEAHDIEDVELSESDGPLWTDSDCDGAAGGEEPTIQLRVVA
jgi:hypothetical protein